VGNADDDTDGSCLCHTKKEPNRSWKAVGRWAPGIIGMIRLLMSVLEHRDQMPF